MAHYEKGNFFIVPNYDYIADMSGGTVKVYLTLCKYADEKGRCYPSQTKIAEVTNLSRRQVIRSLQDLIDLQIIKIHKKVRSDGGLANNVYQLMQLDSKKIANKEPDSDNLSQGASDTDVTYPSDTDVTLTIPNNNYTNNITKVMGNDAKNVTSYGNSDINTLMDEFYNGLGLKPVKVKLQRQYANHLLKRYGVYNALQLIKLAIRLQETEQYAYRVTSMQELWYKQNQVWASFKAKIKDKDNNQIRSV